MSIELFSGLSREEVMAELGRQMQRISEDATCSGWDYRVAEELPRLCYAIARDGKPGDFEGTSVSVALGRWLVAMAEHLGYWVDADRGGWLPYVPLAMKARAI